MKRKRSNVLTTLVEFLQLVFAGTAGTAFIKFTATEPDYGVVTILVALTTVLMFAIILIYIELFKQAKPKN